MLRVGRARTRPPDGSLGATEISKPRVSGTVVGLARVGRTEVLRELRSRVREKTVAVRTDWGRWRDRCG